MGSDVYDDDDGDYSWKIIVVTTLCLVAATVAVGLRFYVRWVIIRNLGYDDWFLAGALVRLPSPSLIPSTNILRSHILQWLLSLQHVSTNCTVCRHYKSNQE